MDVIQLRDKPELRISLAPHGFRIYDAANPNNNGDFTYLDLDHVQYHQERTDWFVSIFSFVADIITGGGLGGRYKDRSRLEFRMSDQAIKIPLINADMDKARAIANRLNKKQPGSATI